MDQGTDKTCGCNCEMCMKGDHKNCQTGMCTLMTSGEDSKE